ncbi:MAG: phosphate ABC transporter permease subunit PstC [Firmicutes bacterium]|nr:phosphate ABC transporter permease subunit PstC [Bacillota bacterium]
MNELAKKKNKPQEIFFKIIFLMSAIFSIIAVLTIFIFILIESFPALAKIGPLDFIFGKTWLANKNDVYDKPLEGSYGVLNFIVGSIYATAGALVLGGVIGFFAAVFLAKFCPKRIKGILTQLVNLLAGIPSVVYGFFGMMVLLPEFMLGQFSRFGYGSGIMAVSIVLGIMILPTVVSLSKTAIEAVDESYFEGAVALGATKSQAVFRVVVPAARRGVFASLILGTGRALGETMAVAMVAGNATGGLPGDLFTSFRTMTTHIVFGAGGGDADPTSVLVGAFTAISAVLLVFIMLINTSFTMISGGKSGFRGGVVIAAFGAIVAVLLCVAIEDWVVRSVIMAVMLAIIALITLKAVRQFRDKRATAASGTDPPKVYASDADQLHYIDAQSTRAERAEAALSKSAAVMPEDAHDGAEPQAQRAPVATSRPGFFVRIKNGLKKAVNGVLFAWKTVIGKLPAIMKGVSIGCGALAVGALIAIVTFVLVKGVPHLNPGFLFSDHGPQRMSDGSIVDKTGLMPSIVSTFMVVGLAALIAFPLGIFTAIYLAEYPKRGSKTVKIIRFFVDTLAGIPSIVFGLFGFILFCGIFGWGLSALAGSVTVALMIIPTTVRATEEALMSVPDAYREGSLALGAGKLRTIYKVVVPSALPGILASLILGVGRVVAESAPLMLTMGASLQPMPKGYKGNATTLAVALYALARENWHTNEAYATACVLIVVVLALNIFSTLLVWWLQKRLLGKSKKAAKKAAAVV